MVSVLRVLAIVVGALGLAACNNSGSDTSGVGSTTGGFTLGGSVSGVTATGLVLASNGVTQPIGSGATSFTFTSALATGTAYKVTVQSTPAGLLCSVADGSGTISNANVTDVQVVCTPRSHTLGGMVSGLAASGLVLLNNGTPLTVSSGATTFSFPAPIPAGTRYSVTVQTAPSGYTCSIANGVGIMGPADVTSVMVTCSTHAFTVGGPINGYGSSGLQLANNAYPIAVMAGATSFTTPLLASGSTYDITVATQPTGLNCTVSNPSGTVGSANITNVAVTCTIQSYSLGGTVTELTASGLVLANGASSVTVPVNSSTFSLPGKVAFGATYAVTVTAQPTGMSCAVTGGAGTMPANNVNNIAVTCGPPRWTWMNGSNTAGAMGVYSGTVTPGARDSVMTWKDGSGNFWLFGGAGTDSSAHSGGFNDVWEYNPTTNLWANVSGSQLVDQSGGGTDPSGRQAGMVWTDSAGNVWLFGGLGYDTGSASSGVYLCDMWKFNMTTRVWSLVMACTHGDYDTFGAFTAANWPPMRAAASTWTDGSGRLWMFGGQEGGAGYNDVWVFDPAQGQWAWMGGANTPDDPGHYGMKGSGATNNIPSARYGVATWKDAGGKVWLFGGAQFDAAAPSHQDFFDDLWVFDPASGNWTWVAGSNAVATVGGIYGTLETPASNNYPGARAGAMTWADSAGNLWMLGGFGYDSSTTQYYLNDLWLYNPTAGQWTWAGGGSTNSGSGTAGVYGTQGTPAAANQPGGRFAAGGWSDASGNFWLFGGVGLDSAGTTAGDLNDLWVY